ncbi:hypothetical protein QBC40DRAFT_49024 [Triangularia verruculosa]|uniref:Uncharacterized protein n=1 Tax=Triangularia verruculosa TaxID=2587418 RepID=A0AAN7AUP3_9PEZI|nr:hypothetical protein QBC40DRAFT_49024 [Triangularia verruculosa]
MGVNMSTLVGWAVILSAAVGYKVYLDNKNRPAVRQSARQLHITEKPSQSRKEPKEKAKRQRVEAYSKDTEETTKNTQVKPRAAKQSAAPSKPVNDSTDDEVDNREFARQLASIKQGTNLNAAKKADEKRQKSVKQSRAQLIDEKPKEPKISAPSSTAGVDADDDASSAASPEAKPVDAGDVSDMLEPTASGPSVLRLTDTEKVKPKKEKKAKEPEKTETKKQRQNRRKKELEQEQRQADERQRKVAEEAQRRQARIAEGRTAKDGSEFTNKAVKESVWTAGNKTEATTTNGQAAPLDTFDTDSYTDVSIPKQTESSSKPATAKQAAAPNNWIASLPSEEEQLKMIEDEEAWNTVPSKKSKKKKTTEATSAGESAGESEPAAATKAQAAPKPRATNGTAPTRPANIISQQSSFAALTPNDDDTSKEWDV